MTTIVYHDGIIACDSRLTAGGTITDDNINKIVKNNGIVFVLSGASADRHHLINAYNDREYQKENIDITGIIDDHGTVYLSSICKDDGFWKEDITNRSHCIGSGSSHAWTALDMGCSAKGAVEMAKKRDIYSGGRIRTHKVSRHK